MDLALFGSRNRPLEWNGYFCGIVILLFSRGLFLGIVILIGIHIPLRREIPIHWGKDDIFQKKPFILYLKKKKKKKGQTLHWLASPYMETIVTPRGGPPRRSERGATTPGAFGGWHRPPRFGATPRVPRGWQATPSSWWAADHPNGWSTTHGFSFSFFLFLII